MIDMKLIYCPHCGDVVRLFYEKRVCKCGKSGGFYTDRLNALISGDAIPLGFDNADFHRAIAEQKDHGWGEVFSAFVIPKKCDTVHEV